MDKCIFSGSTENLNTSMNIKLDDGSVVEVWISDEYADIATPKAVKDAYMEKYASRMSEIEELKAKAAEFGLVLQDINELAKSSETKSESKPESEPEPEPNVKSQPSMSESTFTPTDGARLIDGVTADTKHVSARVSGSVPGVSGLGTEYDITSSDKPSEDLKEGEKAEVSRVRGREGMEVAIPTRRIGKTGETRISVVDTGGDNALQRRFKELAKQSEDNPPDFIRQGYMTRTVRCSLCSGKGVMVNNKKCAKCNGMGSYDINSYG